MFTDLIKHIPWKKLATWAIVILVVDISVFWMVQQDVVPVSGLYLTIVLSFILALVDLITGYRLENKKLNNQRKPKTEMEFKKDVHAPESEFGVIKGSITGNGQTKTSFQGKVDAPKSKFGNIEQ